jgi:hypothetical protein
MSDDDILYRRLSFEQVSESRDFPNSNAFSLRPDEAGLSVDIARLTTEEGCLAHGNRPGLGLAELPASIPRSLGLTVRHDPTPGNYAHAVIEGPISMSVRRRLSRASTIIVRPHTNDRED